MLFTLSLLPSHIKVGVFGVTELLLLTHSQSLKQPFLGEFDIVHKRNDVLACPGPDTLNQRLVIGHRVMFDAEAPRELF